MARTPNLAAMRRHPPRGAEAIEDTNDKLAFLLAMFQSWAHNNNKLSFQKFRSLELGYTLNGKTEFRHKRDSMVYSSSFNPSTEQPWNGPLLRTLSIALPNGSDPWTTTVHRGILHYTNKYKNKGRTLTEEEASRFAPMSMSGAIIRELTL